MKGPKVKGNSLTCQGEQLNAIIYNKMSCHRHKILTNPIKPKKNNKTQKKNNKTQQNPPKNTGLGFFIY
jgi:hypothetical protein